MMSKKTWVEFKDSGLFWWMNQLLHTFGWSIVFDLDLKGNIVEVYPARVKFRGFSEKNNTEGYIKLSKYLEDNIKEISLEAQN